MLVKMDADGVREYNLGLLREDNPNTSFPLDIPPETLAEYGVYPGAVEPYPPYDHRKNVVSGPFVLRDGVWTLTWVVTDAPPHEVASRLDVQWRAVRSERNARLSACDWTQLADTTVNSSTWATYRQALRDLPQTQTDPFNIVWPAPPG